MAEERNTGMEAAKKQLAEERKLTERSREEFAERTKGKPTPTQEENDLHALGANFHEHEPDGSPLDPFVNQTRQHETKHLEAEKPEKGSGYQTRQTAPTPTRGPVHPPASS
jgi:hypothetical protein